MVLRMQKLPDNLTLAKRLQFARKEFTEYNQREVADRIGVSPQAVSQWERGEDTPTLPNLTKLAAILDCPLSWLVTGELEHVSSEEIAAGLPGREQRENNGKSSLENYKSGVPGAVPEVDARAGAGSGQVGDHEIVTLQRGETYVGHRVISDWVFPSAFLRHELHVQPGGIMVLEVVGDSMSPTLETGDRVIVDTSHSRPTPDGIYVIEEGDGPMVKRLQLIRRSEPAEVRIISDNPRHEPYTLRLDDIRIIGRVSGRVSRM
jgi:phage repressor protein C with HTH and peptisase S24 domain